MGDTTESGPTEGLEQPLHRYLKKVSFVLSACSPSLLSVFFGFAFHLLYHYVARELEQTPETHSVGAVVSAVAVVSAAAALSPLASRESAAPCRIGFDSCNLDHFL